MHALDEDLHLPGLRDRGVLALLCVALFCALWAWSALEGYSEADTIEYFDMATEIVEQGRLDPSLTRMRSPAFALVQSPLVLAFKACGAEDMRGTFLAARCLALCASLACVLVSARLGTLVAGRAGGLAAGFLVAVNPVFLFHCVDPLPELSAGALLGLGLERLLRPAPPRRSFAGGALLGLAAVLSYKTLPLVAAAALALVARDRWRRRACWASALGGLAAALAAAAVLDRLVFGVFGLTLANYVIYNARYVVASMLVKLGFSAQASSFIDFAGRYFDDVPNMPVANLERRVELQTPVTWYASHWYELVVPPAALLLCLGLWRSARRPRWATATLVLMLALYLLVLSHKTSKSFRLWLAALPALAALCGVGFDSLLAEARGRARALRLGLGAALLAASAALGALGFQRAGPRLHGHYWRAVAWLEVAAAQAGELQRFGAEGFPVYYRYSSRLELEPIAAVDPALPPEAQLAQVEGELAALDWLIASEHGLALWPALTALIDRDFSVEAAFFEPGNSAGLGPVAVLKRRGPGEGGRRLFEVGAGAPAAEGLAPPAVLARAGEPAETLALVGLAWEELPGDGLVWLRSRWSAETSLSRACLVRLRAETPGGETLFDASFPPAYGLARWEPGAVAADGRCLRLRARDLLASAHLFVSAVQLDEAGRPAEPLVPRAGGAPARGSEVDAGTLAERAAR